MRRWLRDLFGLHPERPVDESTVPAAPRVVLDLARPVPGALVRLVAPALVLLCAALATAGGGGRLLWSLAPLAAVLVAWRPERPVAAGVVLLTGLAVLSGDDPLVRGASGTAGAGELTRVMLLVLAVHLLLRASALAARLSWRSRVEWPVLAAVGRSVLGTQVLVQPLVLAVVWLRGIVGASDTGQDLVRMVAVVAVVAVAALVLPRAWLQRRPSGTAGDRAEAP